MCGVEVTLQGDMKHCETCAPPKAAYDPVVVASIKSLPQSFGLETSPPGEPVAWQWHLRRIKSILTDVQKLRENCESET